MPWKCAEDNVNVPWDMELRHEAAPTKRIKELHARVDVKVPQDQELRQGAAPRNCVKELRRGTESRACACERLNGAT